jgi:hypothetical protein
VNSKSSFAVSPKNSSEGYMSVPAPASSPALSPAEYYAINVLPWPGPGEPGDIILYWKNDGAHTHVAVKSPQEFAEKIRDLARYTTISGIYACQGRIQHFKKTGPDGKPEYRKNHQVSHLKGFFLDIDFKQFAPIGVNDQVTLDRTLETVAAWRIKIGLQPPSLVVNSGGGLQYYWLCDRVMTKAEWEPIAKELERLRVEHKLPADPGVIAVPGHVLRVPGSLNRKAEYGQPRRVTILHPDDWS